MSCQSLGDKKEGLITGDVLLFNLGGSNVSLHFRDLLHLECERHLEREYRWNRGLDI